MLKTQSYAVIGNPINHSLSPKIHHAFAQQTGITLDYTTLETTDKHFESTLQQFRHAGGNGLSVTLPFKQLAFALCHQTTRTATVAHAVNTLTFHADGSIHGANTDGIGLVSDLINKQLALQNQSLLILGDGGAAIGILVALIKQQPHAITLASRNPANAKKKLATMPADNIAVCPYHALSRMTFDLIINATSCSLINQLPPLPEDFSVRHSCCYDLAYFRTKKTIFQHWATQQKASHSFCGWGMLVEQAAQQFLIWHGIKPETNALANINKF